MFAFPPTNMHEDDCIIIHIVIIQNTLIYSIYSMYCILVCLCIGRNVSNDAVVLMICSPDHQWSYNALWLNSWRV